MKGKNVLIISLIFNAILIALLIFVKNDSAGKAKEQVKTVTEGANEAIATVKTARLVSNGLWNLVFSINELEKKDSEGIQSFLTGQQVPSSKKDEMQDVKVEASKEEIKVSAESYYFTISLDAKAKMKGVDVSNLMTTSTLISKDANGILVVK